MFTSLLFILFIKVIEGLIPGDQIITQGNHSLKLHWEKDSHNTFTSMTFQLDQKMYAFTSKKFCQYDNFDLPVFQNDSWQMQMNCSRNQICIINQFQWGDQFPGQVNCCCGLNEIQNVNINKQQELSTAGLIGIIISPFIVLGLAGLGVFYMNYRKKVEKLKKKESKKKRENHYKLENFKQEEQRDNKFDKNISILDNDQEEEKFQQEI